MILLLDNYDSFTWNLHHYLAQLTTEEVVVFRNDAITAERAGDFSRIVFSPGPGMPSGAGVMMEIIRNFSPTKPMLGICLGHQAIGEAFGAKLTNLTHVRHGISREIQVTEKNDGLFRGIPEKFSAGLYHSWILSEDAFPDALSVTARDTDGTIMAISHRKFPLCGVQFHPESIMTTYGMQILKNWLAQTG